MGRKSKIYIILNEFIQREDDKDIETLTKTIIKNLQINKDPLLKLCGDVIQSINEHWHIKYEKFNDKSLEEWIEENNERNIEIDKRKLYQNTAEELSVYKPYYNTFGLIYERHKNMTIIEIEKDYNTNIKDSSFLWNVGKSDLSKEEIMLLKSYKINSLTRKAAFIILLNRFKNNKDFPIKIDFSNDDNIQDEYEKFIKQYDKSLNARNKKLKKK